MKTRFGRPMKTMEMFRERVRFYSGSDADGLTIKGATHQELVVRIAGFTALIGYAPVVVARGRAYDAAGTLVMGPGTPAELRLTRSGGFEALLTHNPDGSRKEQPVWTSVAPEREGGYDDDYQTFPNEWQEVDLQVPTDESLEA